MVVNEDVNVVLAKLVFFVGEFNNVVLIRRFLRSETGTTMGWVVTLIDSEGHALGDSRPLFVLLSNAVGLACGGSGGGGGDCDRTEWGGGGLAEGGGFCGGNEPLPIAHGAVWCGAPCNMSKSLYLRS